MSVRKHLSVRKTSVKETLETQVRTLQINMRGDFKIKRRKDFYANSDSEL